MVLMLIDSFSVFMLQNAFEQIDKMLWLVGFSLLYTKSTLK